MSIQSVSNGSYTNMHNLKESSDINKYWKKNCIGVASKLFINGKSLSEVFKSEFSELKRLDAEADKSDCEEKEGVNPAAQARFAKANLEDKMHEYVNNYLEWTLGSAKGEKFSPVVLQFFSQEALMCIPTEISKRTGGIFQNSDHLDKPSYAVSLRVDARARAHIVAEMRENFDTFIHPEKGEGKLTPSIGFSGRSYFKIKEGSLWGMRAKERATFSLINGMVDKKIPVTKSFESASVIHIPAQKIDEGVLLRKGCQINGLKEQMRFHSLWIDQIKSRILPVLESRDPTKASWVKTLSEHESKLTTIEKKLKELEPLDQSPQKERTVAVCDHEDWCIVQDY